ncbi:MAG: endonuclease MutS2, partial [Myxococcales bacterium]
MANLFPAATDKTLTDLDWPRVLEALAARCVGEPGRRLARALRLSTDRASLALVQAQGREALEALDRGEPLPIYGLRDVDPALERLKMNAVLAPHELRDLGATLASARTLRRYLGTRRDRMPALVSLCTFDPSLDPVEDELTDSFDHDGLLVDHASPRLRELRQQFREARDRIVGRLEELMRRYQNILSDAFWTEREGRYVLPVRSDAQRFPGIVHTASGSGATLFVEPRALIPLGNRLKVIEAEVRREEEAVYARLSGLLGEKLPSVLAAAEALAVADLRAASARLGRDGRMVYVEVAPTPVLEVRDGRHPLLVLDGIDAVPSDLSAESGRAVVISGPNAGGKTVALKTLGLAALMQRAGLPVACAPGSHIGFFDRVLSDVGDDQSLARNLSTFSAHITNVAAILDAAGPSSLVLLDEIATGTDPREGEALAAAVLDQLCDRRAAVVCTTHYEGLKVLALSDDRFINASVGFDLATMNPTFRVITGVPGSSSALAVARRYGIPAEVIDRAGRFLSREDRDFEQMVGRLNDERRALDLARASAERARAAAEQKQRELEVEVERLRDRSRAVVSKEAESLVAAVRQARDDLRAAQARLRGRAPLDEGELRTLGRTINDVAGRAALGGEFEVNAMALDDVRPAGDLRKGARVYVPRLRLEAEILEVMDDQLRIAAGPLKLTVGAHEV